VQDPRQYVRPSGTTYTTLSVLRRTGVYRNKISLLDPKNPNIFTIVTEPKFGIGQRCFFIRTPHGNVLWDMITLLDQETTEWIRAQGGLKAIVISHPHYYTTHWWWSVMLESPVYVSKEDQEWLSFPDVANTYRWITTPTMEIVPGITAIKVGGHFPGSLCLHVKNHADHARLFIADTLVTVPSGLGPFENGKPPPGVATYAFMWSIPNMVSDGS
jgi:glyoxylase-like metal-dependent hydrolase (beta-lactamase superfamily II)